MSSVFKISPTWKFDPNCLDLSLTNFIKDTTSQNTFRSMISEIKANFKYQVWNLLYIEGSKSHYQLPAYAVVDYEEKCLILGALYEHASVFTE